MKLGLLADIHEHVDHLSSALRVFDRHQVDSVVVLGDVFSTGKRIEETVALLVEAGAVGVWGNHELGLCCDPEPQIQSRYSDSVRSFFATLKPTLEYEDVFVSHGCPCWNPSDPEVFYSGEAPWQPAVASQTFATLPHQLFLMGHFHRWLSVPETGDVDWSGQQPLSYGGVRRITICDAVFHGACAILDTSNRLLTPHQLS